MKLINGKVFLVILVIELFLILLEIYCEDEWKSKQKIKIIGFIVHGILWLAAILVVIRGVMQFVIGNAKLEIRNVFALLILVPLIIYFGYLYKKEKFSLYIIGCQFLFFVVFSAMGNRTSISNKELVCAVDDITYCGNEWLSKTHGNMRSIYTEFEEVYEYINNTNKEEYSFSTTSYEIKVIHDVAKGEKEYFNCYRRNICNYFYGMGFYTMRSVENPLVEFHIY